MHKFNEGDRVKMQVVSSVAHALYEDQLDELDRIPIQLRPKDGMHSRCCIYKDRAMLRYRVMAALGYRVEDETDELKTLRSYAEDIKLGRRPVEEYISIISDACSACLESQTTVTNLCRGCLARPCTVTCPRKAITIVNGQAHIDRSLCVNCGLCTKVCSFHAIVQVPLACGEACPVDAIGKTEEGKIRVDHSKCIRCGRCLAACPFSAMATCSQLADVILAIKSGKEVIALTAPALTGIFPNPRHKLNGALLQLGFSSVYDVAQGADETARDEAIELKERLEAGAPFMTTSCCPAWVETVERVIPELKEFVSTTPSPMQYTAKRARAEHPDAILVFIGPCEAKRAEALKKGEPNYVLTAMELGAMLIAKSIDVDSCEDVPFSGEGDGSGFGIRFAVSGGVANSVLNQLEEKPATYAINGLSPKMIKLLKVFAKTKKAPGKLIEVMCCPGGCSAGPCSFEDPTKAAARIQKVSQEEPVKG